MNTGHSMETTEAGTRCSRCLRTASQVNRNRRWCPGIPWYVVGTAPDHLSTASQLKARGLRPIGKAVGCVVTAFGDLVLLYDDAESKPRRGETEKQRAARLATWEKTSEKWRCEHCNRTPASIGDLTSYWIRPELCEECKERLEWQLREARLDAKIERDRASSIAWAVDLFTHPETWALVDTETSSLLGVIVEIAIVAPDGTTIFESLVNPDGIAISEDARSIHGLSDEELAAAPRLPEIWPEIVEALGKRTTLVAYNSAFDQARIEQSARRYDLPMLIQEWQCAMEAYAEFCGNWSDYYGSYTWIPLNGDHRAIEDARAALDRLREMAEEAERKAERAQALRIRT